MAVEPLGGTAEIDGEQAGAMQRYVYLVGSEAAAMAARRLAAGADQVHVVATEEDAAQVRAGLGGPGTHIIDLRAPAVGASSAVTRPGAVRAPGRLLVYIVDSEAARADLLGLLAEADRLRAMHGEPPLSTTVVIAAAGDVTVWQALDELDTQRRGPGLPEVERFDLRAPAAGARGACGTDSEPASC